LDVLDGYKARAQSGSCPSRARMVAHVAATRLWPLVRSSAACLRKYPPCGRGRCRLAMAQKSRNTLVRLACAAGHARRDTGQNVEGNLDRAGPVAPSPPSCSTPCLVPRTSRRVSTDSIHTRPASGCRSFLHALEGDHRTRRRGHTPSYRESQKGRVPGLSGYHMGRTLEGQDLPSGRGDMGACAHPTRSLATTREAEGVLSRMASDPGDRVVSVPERGVNASRAMPRAQGTSRDGSKRVLTHGFCLHTLTPWPRLRVWRYRTVHHRAEEVSSHVNLYAAFF